MAQSQGSSRSQTPLSQLNSPLRGSFGPAPGEDGGLDDGLNDEYDAGTGEVLDGPAFNSPWFRLVHADTFCAALTAVQPQPLSPRCGLPGQRFCPALRRTFPRLHCKLPPPLLRQTRRADSQRCAACSAPGPAAELADPIAALPQSGLRQRRDEEREEQLRQIGAKVREKREKREVAGVVADRDPPAAEELLGEEQAAGDRHLRRHLRKSLTQILRSFDFRPCRCLAGERREQRQQKATVKPFSSAVGISDGMEQVASDQHEYGREQRCTELTMLGPQVPDDAVLNEMQYNDLVILASQCGLRVPGLHDAASARKALQSHRDAPPHVAMSQSPHRRSTAKVRWEDEGEF
eukprot:gene12338-biopygen7305